jgi:hypothetical protein
MTGENRQWPAGLSLPLLLVAGCMGPAAAPDKAGRPADERMQARVEETFRLSEADNWLLRTPALWKLGEERGRRYLQMLQPPARPMTAGVRRPQEYAVYKPYEFRSFSLSCMVRVDRDPATKGRDACIIFGRQDDTHLYYVHLSNLSDGAHNTIIRVDGGTRRRIMPDRVFPRPVITDAGWHKVDVLRNCDTGSIQVFVDARDEKTARPYFEVIDRTYEWGFIALGSFDDFASFGQILIEGEARKPATPASADAAMAPATGPAGGP